MIGVIESNRSGYKYIMTRHGGSASRKNIIDFDKIHKSTPPYMFLHKSDYDNYRLVIPGVFL